LPSSSSASKRSCGAPLAKHVPAALAGRPGAVLRRRELVLAAWPDGAIVHDNTLDAYIARLRRKLCDLGATEEIATTSGVGYVLR
jgi:two-component system OmpR family response regulator